MDQSIKLLISMITSFLFVMLLISCISLHVASSNARSVLYSSIEYVEINGYGSAKSIQDLEKYAIKNNVVIHVQKEDTGNDFSQWTIVVSYQHKISIPFSIDRYYSIEGKTRAIFI